MHACAGKKRAVRLPNQTSICRQISIACHDTAQGVHGCSEHAMQSLLRPRFQRNIIMRHAFLKETEGMAVAYHGMWCRSLRASCDQMGPRV